MGWKEDGKQDFAGNFVKFAPGESKIIQFLGLPEKRKFKPDDSDKEKISYDFPVIEYGLKGEDTIKRLLSGSIKVEDLTPTTRTLSVTSKRLFDALSEEDDDEPIVNRTLIIRAVGAGFERQWRLKSIPKITQTNAEENGWESPTKREVKIKAIPPDPKEEKAAKEIWEGDIDKLDPKPGQKRKKASDITGEKYKEYYGEEGS